MAKIKRPIIGRSLSALLKDEPTVDTEKEDLKKIILEQKIIINYLETELKKALKENLIITKQTE